MRNSYDAWQLENDRTQVLRSVVQDRMRPITKHRLGELSRNDRTLAGLRLVVIKLTRLVMNGTSLEMTGLGRGTSGLGIVLRPIIT